MTQKRAKPARGLPGTVGAGMTNAECIEGLREVLGGPPVVGNLYRLRVRQEAEGKPGQAIAEFRGFVTDLVTGYPEPAFSFAIVNPAPVVDASSGTREHPWTVWPLDIDYLAPAEAGDLDTPLAPRVSGEPVARPVPGTPVQ
jgi:hypothetical protein